MWEIKILGVSIYNILNWFFIYSFMGWVWESCYVSAKEKRFVNRGFVTGPVCTIYGCGALSVYLLLWKHQSNLIFLFFAGMLVATILEYVTSYFMELIFHASWWDYSSQKYNLNGRICLGASLGWGVFTLILFYVFQPAVEKITSWYPDTIGKIAVVIVMIIHIADLIASAVAAFDLRRKLDSLDKVMDELTAYLMSTRFYETTTDMKAKVQHIKENFSASDFSERQGRRLEIRLAVLNDYLNQHGLKEYKEEAKEKISSIQNKLKESYAENNFFRKRMLNAYPHLKSIARKTKDMSIYKVIRKDKEKRE